MGDWQGTRGLGKPGDLSTSRCPMEDPTVYSVMSVELLKVVGLFCFILTHAGDNVLERLL